LIFGAVALYWLALSEKECYHDIQWPLGQIYPKIKECSHMAYKPLHDRIIIQRLEEQDKTAGGIIIPDTAKEKPQQGKVIAVGTGIILKDGKTVPLQLKPGDRVIFSKYGGTEVKFGNEDYLIMREDDILGVIE
jgi:chaperonin GroES